MLDMYDIAVTIARSCFQSDLLYYNSNNYE